MTETIPPNPLSYETPVASPNSRRLALIRHEDGISIALLTHPFWAAMGSVARMMEGGLEGCAVVLLSPILLGAAAVWALLSGFSFGSIVAVLISTALTLLPFLFYRSERRGSTISVRAGRMSLVRPQSRRDGSDILECDVIDITDIQAGVDRPIILLKDGKEFFDSIKLRDYQRLTDSEKQWVISTLRRVVGLPEIAPV